MNKVSIYLTSLGGEVLSTRAQSCSVCVSCLHQGMVTNNTQLYCFHICDTDMKLRCEIPLILSDKPRQSDRFSQA